MNAIEKLERDYRHRIRSATKPEDVLTILGEAESDGRIKPEFYNWLEDVAEGRIDELVPEKEAQ